MSVVWFHIAKRRKAAAQERPILFSGPMVNAIRGNVKSQTRRSIDRLAGLGEISEFGPSDTPGFKWHFRDRRRRWQELHDDAELLALCPYGKVGDRLWVRETWYPVSTFDPSPETGALYRADYLDDVHGPDGERSPEGRYRKWKPSIHMPRWASRVLLELTAVRFELLHDISEADARAEGCYAKDELIAAGADTNARFKFRFLWESIHGRDTWLLNHYVWVLTFRQVGEP